MTPWEIQADELVNCNCAYGCPCQFKDSYAQFAHIHLSNNGIVS